MDDFIFSSGPTNTLGTFEPQITPNIMQMFFKLSNGNVIPQAKKFFGSWTFSTFCTVCQKRREVSGDDIQFIAIASSSSHIYLWCALHKHLKTTPVIEKSAKIPLPVIEPAMAPMRRKFKGD